MLSIQDSYTATLFFKYAMKEVRRHYDVIQRDMLHWLKKYISQAMPAGPSDEGWLEER
jgi:hypothetical protein